jgi:hypothetical protein
VMIRAVLDSIQSSRRIVSQPETTSDIQTKKRRNANRS